MALGLKEEKKRKEERKDERRQGKEQEGSASLSWLSRDGTLLV